MIGTDLRRRWPLVAGLLTLACTASAPGSPPARPNVLFIAVDDLRPELGCYGVSHARTPHLDRLAESGVLFRRHYVQVPTCGASRYSMLTGRSPRHTGALSNQAFYRGATALDPTPTPGARTMPELFRRAGYRTVQIGKLSHTPDGMVYAYSGEGDGRPELPGAWDELATPYGPWARGWGAFFAYSGGRHREDGQGHRDLMEFVAERDEDLPDGLMAARAVEELGELARADQPFFLGLGFFKPHLPFVATRGDWEAMAAVDVPPPPHPEPTGSRFRSSSGELYGYDAPHEKTRPLAPADQIEVRRAYLACVRYVDRQIGKVLDALDELGLAESTIVVVWGDHGWHLGDSGIWGKHTPHERALRSTLIVRAPGVSEPGRASDALVESLDLYPTLVDLCGLGNRPTEHPLDGLSLRPLLTGEREALRETATSWWSTQISVCSPDHRLIVEQVRAARTRELYDLRPGPDPLEPVADEAARSRLEASLAH